MIQDYTGSIELILVATALIAVAAKAVHGLYRVVSRIADIGEFLDEQMRPNAGSSLRDAVNRIEANQKSVSDEMKATQEAIANHHEWHQRHSGVNG